LTLSPAAKSLLAIHPRAGFNLSIMRLKRTLSHAVAVMIILQAASTATAAEQIISTLAGNGTKGFSGDGGLAAQAQLDDPTGIVCGPDGELYICDTANHRIRKVSADGKISTIAGTGEKGWSGDGGPATAAKLNEPYEVRLDRDGNLFWVERLSHTVRKRDAKTGIITTIAGNGTAGFSGDGGLATKAQLNEPHSIVLDKTAVYICDVRNHRVRKVDMKSGTISTFAGTGERQPTPDGAQFGSAPLFGPRALAFGAGGDLWLALREGNVILKLDLAKGTVHHIAGTGKKGFAGDGGPAKDAMLNGPKGISVAPNGDVYIADTENHAIRRIDPRTGRIFLVTGTGARGDGPDGDPLKCQLARPHGIFTAECYGAILIGDSENHRVRVIRTNRPR
jgi:streptogramin lyase